MNLYLDVDGVLLGKEQPDSSNVVLARHAEDFLRFVLDTFDCYWLTTHCRGDTKTVLDYLRSYSPTGVMELMSGIRPTKFRTLKTEALKGDFYWIDDSPLAVERAWLEERELLERWIEVDTRKLPDDLLRAMTILRETT